MAILLVPGFMTDAALWDDCVEAFAPFGPIGHVDISRDDGIEGIASRALRDAPARFLLVGFSFGGYVAREMVRRAPDRVQALVLAATSARGSVPGRVGTGRRAAGTVGTAFSGLSRRSIETALHPNHADEVTVERIRAMSARLGAEVFRRQSMMQRQGDLDRLGEIGCPTLIVAAAEDRLRTLDEARELHEGIPNADMALIEGCGHMIPIEAPDAFAAAVLDWLKTLRLQEEAPV